jgi:hypothetical protein
MDLVNPFKAGDDMLYVQYLQDNGNDVQAAYVFRRDVVSGDAKADESTAAIKYHGFAGEAEYDLLLARSYGDAVIGVGAGRDIGGAVWSSDLVVTDTDLDTYVQFVSNVMYSWIWGGRNISGSLEYYFNGFGQSDGRYDPISLAMNPDLLVRLSRGELFTLGRHYFSANMMIEMSPLWILTPTVFMNVEDPSALFQLVTTQDRAAPSLVGLNRVCPAVTCPAAPDCSPSSPGISSAGTAASPASGWQSDA